MLLFLAALLDHGDRGERPASSGVKISKIHAAYSLGASKWQILRHVIIPTTRCPISSPARASRWGSAGARWSPPNWWPPAKRAPA